MSVSFRPSVSVSPWPTMLGPQLTALDIPADGSARLVSVETSVDDDGCTRWVVVFKEVKPKGGGAATGASSAAHAAPAPPTAATPTGARAPPDLLPDAALGHVSFAPTPTNLSPRVPLAPVCFAPVAAAPAATDPLSLMDRIFPLKCAVKTYAWGKLGEASLVGRLAELGLDELDLHPGTPYAELWMGTHPSGPSNVMLTSPWRTVTPLSEWIKLNPSLLGPTRPARDTRLERRRSMLRMSAHSLPFLFKVLSVRTALSIQAHPDKALAVRLHVRTPDMYKDDNHKPEMAVAITPFEALCSFQPAYSIIDNCNATPELVALIGEKAVAAVDAAASLRARVSNAAHGMGGRFGASASSAAPTADDATEAFREALRTLFRNLMLAPSELVKTQLEALMRRVASTNEMLRAPVDVLAKRLHEQYPADVGVFCVYLLNYTRLQPGEALYLGANEPHAYISGDCAEIMATSDNVVRAGLTPKWKDVDTLCDMLTYSDGSPHFVVPTQPADEPHVWRYLPPPETDEFMLQRVEMAHEGQAASLPPCLGLAILLVVRGALAVDQFDEASDEPIGLSHQLNAGAVYLVCPQTALRMRATHASTLVFLGSAKPPEDDGELSPSPGPTSPTVTPTQDPDLAPLIGRKPVAVHDRGHGAGGDGSARAPIGEERRVDAKPATSE